MIIQVERNIVINIFDSNCVFTDLIKDEFFEVDNAEIGDRYINGEIVKPSFFYAHEIDEEHRLEFVKSFEEINEDLYYNIGSREFYDEYVNSGKTYVEKNGTIEEYVPPVTKEEKIEQLEDFIYNKKDMGFLFNEKRFKCDDLASSRINKIVTGILAGASPFPLTWITRNSQEGIVVFNTKEEFMEFYNAMSTFELEVQVQEANLKMQIELANSQEELDNIVFE